MCKSQLNFRIQNAGFELLNVTSYDNEIGHKVGNCIRIEIADVEYVNLTYLISKKKNPKNPNKQLAQMKRQGISDFKMAVSPH